MKVQLILATADATITSALITMLSNIRNYLVVHSVVDGPYIADPVANFAYRAFTSNPLTITFTNTSTDAVSYSWNFGDGTNSISENPIHTYAQSGTYIVSLTVQNINSVLDTVTKNITVLADPVADFTYEVNAVDPLTIEFTNTSTDAVSYSWDFGDGTPPDTTANPIHTYAQSGAYIVSLTVQNAANVPNTKTETITV